MIEEDQNRESQRGEDLSRSLADQGGDLRGEDQAPDQEGALCPDSMIGGDQDHITEGKRADTEMT